MEILKTKSKARLEIWMTCMVTWKMVNMVNIKECQTELFPNTFWVGLLNLVSFVSKRPRNFPDKLSFLQFKLLVKILKKSIRGWYWQNLSSGFSRTIARGAERIRSRERKNVSFSIKAYQYPLRRIPMAY